MTQPDVYFRRADVYIDDGFTGPENIASLGANILPPVVDFSATPLIGVAPLTVDFTNLSQYGVSDAWDFQNNGSTDSVLHSPTGIVFGSPGLYSVKLTVTNTAGTVSLTKVNYIDVGSLPIVDFSGTPLSGNAPLDVTFTNLSSGAVSYAWDFENNGSTDSTATNPTHTYPDPGTYTVKLTGTNAYGSATQTKTAYVTVNAVGNRNALLTFESLFPTGDKSLDAAVLNHYNGGTDSNGNSGRNYGIVFDANSIVSYSLYEDGTADGNFVSNPSKGAAVSSLGGTITITIAGGFYEQVVASLIVLSGSTVTMRVKNPADAVIATTTLPFTSTGTVYDDSNTPQTVDVWEKITLAFAGEGRKLEIAGTVNQVAIDNILFRLPSSPLNPSIIDPDVGGTLTANVSNGAVTWFAMEWDGERDYDFALTGGAAASAKAYVYKGELSTPTSFTSAAPYALDHAGGIVKFPNYGSSSPDTVWVGVTASSGASASAGLTVTPGSGAVNPVNLQVTERDRSFASVLWLLDGQGADNSTTFTDLSTNARTVTPTGNTKISTAQFKFGSSSIYFDGVGDNLTLADTPDMNITGSFNFRGWFYIEANTSLNMTFLAFGGATHWQLYRRTASSNKLVLWNGSSNIIIGSTTQIGTTAWYHIEWSFDGTTHRIFVNGNLEGSAVSALSVNPTSMIVGTYFDGTEAFQGWAQDIEATTVARHTAAFTIPRYKLPAA